MGTILRCVRPSSTSRFLPELISDSASSRIPDQPTMLGGFYAHTISEAQRTTPKDRLTQRHGPEGRLRTGTTDSNDSSMHTHGSGPDAAIYYEYKPSFRFCLDTMIVDLIKSVDGGVTQHEKPRRVHHEAVDHQKPVMRMTYSGGIFT
ncbi:hypothetical protein SDRG_00848 [Saprolegnia diclina VS20]|uniref:Uncharacterized protein n=1 Tax=Saprolegnia diclina (strain VS20) TaxID=1156394 RepID=T0R4X4_SAPDV|nr:hypothetical protein SDRG_00848 [Saprolegnia diclina VS20]EQC42001.1 hypothetical protein SDRG_00848 [Saprolegnia diclina VS20]|eukprot:XP_008604570.1 hypothetical protein SDRG_00848 [Saprolegnia diclina VS20]